MGYTPTQRSDTLTIYLGYVYGCTIDAGSHTLHAGTAIFNASDVGRTVTIIGAGYPTPRSVTVGGRYTVSSGSWAAGIATLDIGAHTLPVSQLISVVFSNPGGYDVAATPITAVTGTTISYAVASNPGAWVSGSYVYLSSASMFKSTITALSAGSPPTYPCGVATLADAAITSQTGLNSQLTVYRPITGNVVYVPQNPPIHYDNSLTQKATLSFGIWSSDGTGVPKRGQPVWMYDSADDGTGNPVGDVFGGYIDKVTVSNVPGNPVALQITCDCVDWAGILTRRLVGSYNSAYTNLTTDRLALAIIYDHVDGEGFFVSSTNGPIIPFVQYDYTSDAGAALDDVCTKSFSPGTSKNVTGASWAAGIATLTIGAHVLFVGETIVVTGAAPAGYNTASAAITAVTGTTISYAVASNPGAWTSGGSVAYTTHSYFWYCDPWKVIHIVTQTSQPAPWTIDDTLSSAYPVTGATWAAGIATLTIGAHIIAVGQTIEVTSVTPGGYDTAPTPVTAVGPTTVSYAVAVNPGAWTSGGDVFYSSDGNVLVQIQVITTGEKKANRCYVAASQELQDAVTETFSGDSSAKEWNTNSPIGSPPTIVLNGSINASVGVDGLDSGKNFYWTLGSSTIKQDPGGGPPTILYPLQKGAQMAVTYQGYTVSQGWSQYNAGVDAAAFVEGGTGFYDLYLTLDTPSSKGDAQAIAVAEAISSSDNPIRISVSTYRGGLHAGQHTTVRLAQFGVNAEFLIESVTMDTQENLKLWNASLVSGPLIGDWRDAIINLTAEAKFGGAGPQDAPPGGGPPWDGLEYLVHVNNYGRIAFDGISFRIHGTSLTGINFNVVYIDELTEDCYVTTTSSVPGPVGSPPTLVTDPITMVVTPNPAQTSSLTFEVGDWLIWDDPGKYEIGQLIAKSGSPPTTWTIRRYYPGELKGDSTFEAPCTAHPSGIRLYKGQVKQFLFSAKTEGFTLGGVNSFDKALPCVCVVAVTAASYNDVVYGTWTTVNCATATVPGLRTGIGGEFSLQCETVAAAPGSNVMINDHSVDLTQTQRVNFCYTADPVAGTNLVVHVRISSDGGSTWSTLESLTVAVGQTNSWPSVSLPKNQKTPYSGTWPFRVLFAGDLLNFTVESGSATGIMVKLDT